MPKRRPTRRLITCLGETLVDFLPVTEGGRTVGFRIGRTFATDSQALTDP